VYLQFTLLSIAHLFFSVSSGRFAAVDSLKDLNSPSMVIQSLEGMQTASKSLIHGRPVESLGLQTALYNPVIAQLAYDLDHLDTVYPHPSEDHLGQCLKVMEISNRFYPTGVSAEKWGDLDDYFGIFLDGYEDRIRVNNVVNGAMVSVLCVYGVFESENEYGLGGDPFFRAMVSYAKAIQDKKVSNKLINRGSVSPYSATHRTCSNGPIFLRFSSAWPGMCSPSAQLSLRIPSTSTHS